MKPTKIAFLTILSGALLLTGCGGNKGEGKSTLHEAYEFSNVENADESAMGVLDIYKNSYIEFTVSDENDEGIALDYWGDYRFSYIVSMSYGETIIEQWYDEYGTFSLSQDKSIDYTYFNYSYNYTFIDGVRSKAEQANTFSYKLKGDTLLVDVKNGDFTLGSLVMTPTSKRTPSYAADATHIVNRSGTKSGAPEEDTDWYVDSRAYLGEDNKFYFTYYAPYKTGQNCVVKEEGVITDTTDPYRDNVHELKISKRTKYFQNEKISEETVDISYWINLRPEELEEFGETGYSFYIDLHQSTLSGDRLWFRSISAEFPKN